MSSWLLTSLLSLLLMTFNKTSNYASIKYWHAKILVLLPYPYPLILTWIMKSTREETISNKCHISIIEHLLQWVSVARIVLCSVSNARGYKSRFHIVHLICTDSNNFVQVHISFQFYIIIIITCKHNQ